MFGMTPSSVVSAAPTTATSFLRMLLPLRRTEQGKSDLVVQLLEPDLNLHVELERFRRLRAVDDVGHHPRTLVELDHRNGVGGRKARSSGAVVDDIAIKLALAACLEDRYFSRGAGGAERPWREIDVRAGIAALQPQLAGLRAVPEMPGLRCRFWFRARRLGHADYFLPEFVVILMRHLTNTRQRLSHAFMHAAYSTARTMDRARMLVPLRSRA